MKETRHRLLGVLAATVSVVFGLWAIWICSVFVTRYHPLTLFDRVASYSVLALIFALAFLAMRFAAKNMR